MNYRKSKFRACNVIIAMQEIPPSVCYMRRREVLAFVQLFLSF